MSSKKNRLILSITGFAVLVLVTGLALVVANAANSEAHVNTNKVLAATLATVTPDKDKVVPVTIGAPFNKDSKPMEFFGRPGVKPYLAAKDSQTATFTEQDVLDFVKNEPRGGIETSSTTHPTTTKVVFGNSKDLKAQGYIFSKLPYADDRLLCYIELEGNFQSTTRSEPGVIKINKTAMILMDGQTGNIIMSN